MERSCFSSITLGERLDREGLPELHVCFRAPDRATVDAIWQAGIDAAHPDDSAWPARAPRPDYGRLCSDSIVGAHATVRPSAESPQSRSRVSHRSSWLSLWMSL